MDKTYLSIENAGQMTEEMNQFLQASTILANQLGDRDADKLTEAEKAFLGQYHLFNDKFQQVRDNKQM